MPNILHGVVTKTGAMAKTITVTIARRFEHPRLLKQIERHHKMLVHDERLEAKLGDQVTILHGKPISKRKHFKLLSIDSRPGQATIAQSVPISGMTSEATGPAQI